MKKSPPEWLERVKLTHNYHVKQCNSHFKWTITNTAKELDRSYGSVAEDLKVASWLRTHSSQLEEFDNFSDAIAWIREKHKTLNQELE